jgi:hypothetical protein
MDVMLDVPMDNLTTVTGELKEQLQKFLMPALPGCDPSFFWTTPKPTTPLIEYALVEAEYLIVRGLCLAEFDPPCYHYFIHLDIFVSHLVGSEDFAE